MGRLEMDKKNLFFELECMTAQLFYGHVNDGVEIIAAPQFGNLTDSKYNRLFTNTGRYWLVAMSETDITKVKDAYKKYDIYYLNMTSKTATAKFKLSNSPNNPIAYVFVPKQDEDTKYNEKDIRLLETLIEMFYNNSFIWNIRLCQGDKDLEIKTFESKSGNITNEANEWFEMCKAKYSISEGIIEDAKSVIRSHKYREWMASCADYKYKINTITEK